MNKTMIVFCMALLTTVLSHSQSVTVLFPDGGVPWELNSNQFVVWNPVGISGTAKLVLFQNNLKVGNIVQNISVESKMYNWIVGTYEGGKATPGANFTIRVITMDGQYSDFSNAFSISPAAQTPQTQMKDKRAGAFDPVAGTNVALFMKPDFVILRVAYGNGMLRAQVKNQGGAFSGYLVLKIFFVGVPGSPGSTPSESKTFDGVKFLADQEAELAMPLQTPARIFYNVDVLVELTSGGGTAESNTQNNSWQGRPLPN